MMVVAGGRSTLIKAAALLRAAELAGHRGLLVDTGRRQRASVLAPFLSDLGLPEPAYHLGAGHGSHAVQAAAVMDSFEAVLLEADADWLVLPGDTGHTAACAVVAARFRDRTATRTARLGAGLRCGDWSMPEELNRIVTDRLADLLLAPCCGCRTNLEAEGVPADRVALVGNLAMDVLLRQLPAARELDPARRHGLARGDYVLATVHRPATICHARHLAAVLAGLDRVRDHMPVLLVMHPATLDAVHRSGLHRLLHRLTVLEPVGYREMLGLVDAAAVVLTDSGSLQEETTALGVPCVTIRQSTERHLTVSHGTNRLAPWPPTPEGILDSFRDALDDGRRADPPCPEGWDGQAGQRAVDALTGGGLAGRGRVPTA